MMDHFIMALAYALALVYLYKIPTNKRNSEEI
jgi:hypothetical protein